MRRRVPELARSAGRVARRGVRGDATRTAAEALDRGALCLPTAAIIELVLPDGDGVEVCRRLREWSAMPVILLSAVGDEEEQVRALEAGADDYVTKPFRPRELVARLLANLRRAEPGGEEPRVELDALEIDVAARFVRRDGDEVHLTPIEFRLLAVLTQNRGRLLTHNSLLQQVWGATYLDARQTLRAHVANLRRKIEPTDGKRLIHTGHGVGYRLADVHHESASRGRPELGTPGPRRPRRGQSYPDRPRRRSGPRTCLRGATVVLPRAQVPLVQARGDTAPCAGRRIARASLQTACCDGRTQPPPDRQPLHGARQLSRAASAAFTPVGSTCCLSWWRDFTPSLRNALRRW